MTELVGTWAAAVASHELRRVAVEPDHDDRGWERVPVPGHWRSVPAFADSDGPLLYRRRFEADPPAEGERRWLVFDGIFYQSDVWLDGAYLGDTEGYFAPDAFEVTDLLRDRTEHLLAVEVSCAPQRDKAAKRNLTGVFQHWHAMDDTWNPGGIWRPVRLESTGPIRIRDLRVLCREASEARAVVVLRANLQTAEPTAAVVRSSVGGTDHELTQQLAAGENHVEWTITVPQPELWWPWALGGQPLHEVAVEVAPADRPDEVSHRRTVRTGLRQVELRDWVLRVNGERLFLKGTNLAPTRQALAEATPEELRRDVELAKQAGLDLLRVHAHISRPELYEAADEAGLVIWQDLPLQWGYARSVRKQAVRQAAAAVRLLGHHPSVAVWCGHDEPLAVDRSRAPDDPAGAARLGARVVAGMQLPTWNRSILDRSIARTLRRADGTRPVVPHSGVWPHLPTLDGTDSHLWFGWYHGDERDLPRFCAAMPRMARFVSELGAQAVPDWVGEDVDLEALGAEVRWLERHVPRGEHRSFAEWRLATQRYQARLLKRQVEELRRLKYRPTGGFAQFSFADPAPRVSWSVLDHERRPKLGYEALRAACAPVIVVADRLPATVAPGDGLALAVHVVSDLRHPLEGLELTATLSWDGGAHRWRFRGDVPADACVRVGTLQLEVPDAPGRLALELELAGDGVPGGVARNADETVVTA